MQHHVISFREIIERQEANKPVLSLATGENHYIAVQFPLYVLEVEDVLFRHSSAVFMPDGSEGDGSPEQENISGLNVFKAVFQFLEKKENKNKKILISGHTDASGETAYNFTLSRFRAETVQYILTGDKEAWQKKFFQREFDGIQTYCNEDIQQILKWAWINRRWDCDPGSIDGIIGDRTSAAIKIFQESYNRDFSQSIAVDGRMGKQTWGAFFDLYEAELIRILGTDAAGISGLRGNLQWANGGDKNQSTVGCGESFPVADTEAANYRSAANRRVEILFLDPIEISGLDCHKANAQSEICGTKSCPVYGTGQFVREYIVPLKDIITEAGYKLFMATDDGDPLCGKPYRIHVDGKIVREGETDKKGCIIFETKKEPKTGKLEFLGEEYLLEFHNDIPVDTGKGIQTRLSNLSFYNGAITGSIDEDTKTSISYFQNSRPEIEEVSGSADNITRKCLQEIHDRKS